MTNDLTNIIHKTIARGLLVLRKRLILPRTIANEYSEEAKQKNDVINVPIAKPKTASAVTPGPTPPQFGDSTPNNVQIPLDQWDYSDCGLTDADLQKIDVDKHFIPMELDACMNALAEKVNTYLWGKFYKEVYGYAGTAGTTPFATTTTAATDLRKVLAAQRCPRTNRHAILNFDAEANALGLAAFRDVSQSGKDTPVIEGELGRFFGFDWDSDDDVPTHTAGTITTGLIAKASTAQAVDDTTIVCTTAASTGACALVAGDIVTFAGHTQTYVLTAAATQATAATDVTLNISPGLKVALAGSEAVSVKATHVVNLGFERSAFAFASRPLLETTKMFSGGVTMISMTDEVSKIALRVQIVRQWMQTAWVFDILYGGKCVRPEKAARLAG